MNRPFVLLNMAMTADGKIATENRSISRFGSQHDLTHLYELRSTVDAILCGAQTLRSENVDLGPGPKRFREQRLKAGLPEFPLRVLVSGSGRVDPRAKIFSRKFSPIVILTTRKAPAHRLARLRDRAHLEIVGAEEADLDRALRLLRDKWKVGRLLVEGGGVLNDAFFRAGFIDELHLTVCPFVAGGRSSPTISDGKGFLRLAEARGYALQSARRKGAELFLVFRSADQTLASK